MDNKQTKNEPLSHQEAEEMWNAIIARIRSQELKKRKLKIIRFSYSLAAAVLLLLVSILTYKSYLSPDVYYAKESETTVILKDNTQVTLYKGAKLTVEKSFPSDTREVVLEGNAVFNVSKSKIHPFIVHAGSYQAKVLGTVFKVNQIGSTFNIDLYEGKVQVSKTGKPKESFIILPKETFSNMGSDQVASVISTNRKDSGKKSLKATLSFTDFYLKDALTVVERAYGIKVKFPAQKASTKISFESKDATADELIQRISIQLNLIIKKTDANTFELEQ